MTITPFGDSAILINFEQIVDEKINIRVVALSDAIVSAQINGVTFCTPSYCSITIGFDPIQIQYNNLVKLVNALYSEINETGKTLDSRRFIIPVCYEGGFAIDKEDVLSQTNISWPEVVHLHTARDFRVYMLGFIAGFAYMGKLPKALVCNRKATPRMHIPAGTVGIAGLQTGIYPTKAHAGWQLIGRTPIPIFDFKSKTPFLFRAGDKVQFQPITSGIYQEIRDKVNSGTFDIRSVIEVE